MKKQFLFLVMVFLGLTLKSFSYCSPTFTNSSGDFINGVQLGAINNVNTGPAAGAPYYSNYTSMSAILITGNTYTMTVQCGTWASASNNIAAWIDFNHNNIFDPTEMIGFVANMIGLQTSTIVFTVPVTAIAGNTTMRVREMYSTPIANFDPCNNFPFGETEDYNIFIPAPGPFDIATAALLAPKNGCGLSTNEVLQVVVFNAGTDTIFNFSVGFDVNNGFSTGSLSYTDTILPLTADTVLIGGADLSTQGLNTITIYSSIAGDLLPQDDTLHTSVLHYPTINTFPWLEDFESSSPPWVTTGGSWTLTGALGFPFLSAYGGLQMAAVTNGGAGQLIGPCFDFTTLKNPTLKFYFNQYTPFGANYILVMGSVNGGQTFVQLDSIDLYNSAFSTYPGGWKEFQVCMGAFRGQSNVGLKFVSVSSFYDFGIDNVLIYDAIDSSSISATPSVLCGGGVTTVAIQQTNQNYSYFIADHNFNNVSGNPVPGNGGTINLVTFPLFANDTLHVGFVDSTEHGFCSNFSDSIVTILVYPLTNANAGPDTAFCAGVGLAMNGTGGVFYNWAPSLGLSNTNIPNPVANASGTVTYILTASNLGGCATFDTVVVSVNPMPVADAGLNQVICGINTVNIGGAPSVTGGTGPFTYSWLPATGLSSNTTSNPTANPSSVTTYSLVVSDANLCSASDAVIVDVDPAMSFTMNASNITCNNANNGMASITVTGGTLNYAYQWTTTPIQTTSSVANLSANTYSVLVTDAKGCTVSGSANIINPPPVTLSVTNANTSCGLCNGKIYLFPSGGTAPFTYSPTPFIPIINDSAINVCNGIYNFTVSDVNGCSGSSSTNLTGPGGSTGFTVSAGGDITLCNGFSANVGGVPTLNGGNLPYTYTWTPAFGLSSPTASNPLANPSSSTTYVISASDAMGCTKKDTVVVTVNAIPFANAGADISYCYGLIGAIGGPSTPGLTYQWAPSAGLNNATISNPQVNVLTSQNYTLTVTDANGCQNIDQVNVTMNPLPVVSAGPDVIILNGSSATLNGSGANSYLWTPPTSLSGSTIANPVATPNATTTYVLTGTDANGCVDNDLVTVFVYAANGIDELGNSIGLKIYPNPFVDYATIEFELYKNTKLGIRLFDAGGKQVKEIKNENFSFGKHTVTFDVNELARGMYLLMLQTEDGVSIRRLVKQ